MSNRPPRLWRPKPDVLTEGEPWTGILENLPDEWLELDLISQDDGDAIVRTLHGLATAKLGDYIVRGVAGEIYPVKRAVFRAKYEPADDPDDDPAEDAAFEAATQATREAIARAISKDQP